MKVLGFVLLFVAMASAKPSERNSISAQCPSTNDPNSWAVHLADPEDCGKYYICDWGQAISMPCPSGLHFNPTLQVCDWPANAGCTAGQNPSTEAPATGTAILPNPEDCASFFVCDAGESFLVTCPAGKAFSARYSSCVEAAQDGCTPATEAPV
ncbi:unnamed protein product, partial [Notodromas monacha]